MLARLLMTGALLFVIAFTVAACSTSSEGPANTDGLRRAAGTSLIGARGATRQDQHKIDETAAGFCGANVWTRSQCAQHQRETREKL